MFISDIEEEIMSFNECRNHIKFWCGPLDDVIAYSKGEFIQTDDSFNVFNSIHQKDETINFHTEPVITTSIFSIS